KSRYEAAEESCDREYEDGEFAHCRMKFLEYPQVPKVAQYKITYLPAARIVLNGLQRRKATTGTRLAV
ncbi:MAG: hypothetical protein DME65_02665, partial [Verrucomicrobia bacterium]